MKIKRIASIAIIAALPFAANAENISGDMYAAPAHYDNNHPAPTTNGYAPFGRINIDTDDQEHIATTAYVKGAYNSAIAGVNKLFRDKQDVLRNDDDEYIDQVVYTADNFVTSLAAGGELTSLDETLHLVTADGIVAGILSQRVKIYTTWDDDRDSATTEVSLVTATSSN